MLSFEGLAVTVYFVPLTVSVALAPIDIDAGKWNGFVLPTS